VGTVEEHLALEQSTLKGNFVIRFWRGDYSLGVSYWAFGAGTYIVVGLTAFLTALVAHMLGANDRQTILAMLLTSAIPMVWCWVGIWSSANNHVSRTGRKGWASAAQVMVVIGVIGSVGDAGHLLGGTSGGILGVRRDLDESEPSTIRATEQLSDVRTSLDAQFIAPPRDRMESFVGELNTAVDQLSPADKASFVEAMGFLTYAAGEYIKENEPARFATWDQKDVVAHSLNKMYNFAQDNGDKMTLRKYIVLADEIKKQRPDWLQQYRAANRQP
jgi:hypothetical protein